MDRPNIRLSVLIFTYNHADFIGETLQGVLNQKVDFSYEIIVSDDFSTDATMEIVSEFQEKHPSIIKVLKSEKNGILKNSLRVIEHIKGEYMAHVDGDDYWTYDQKLQKQIDFLDSNLDYNAVFHDATIVHDSEAEKLLFTNKKTYSQVYNYPKNIYPSDLINRLILPTASCVLRTSALKKIDLSKINDYYSLDWKIYVLAIMGSKFYYFNEAWSVYRNHSKGISKSKNQDFHFSHIKFLKTLFKDEYYKDYKYDIYKSISKEYEILLNSKESKSIRRIFKQYLITEINRLRFYKKRLYEINKSKIQ